MKNDSSLRVPISQAFSAIAATRATTKITWPRDPHLGAGLDEGDIAALLAVVDDREFVEQAYLRLVHRPADEAGLMIHVAALESGAPRVHRLASIADSPEAWMSDFNGRSLAAIRAEHGALLLAQAGSSLGRKHLSAARWLNNEWSVLWVDAVREVIPGILGTEEDLLAFTARMDSLGDPRLATLEAWRAAIARRGLFAHWGSRALMRVTWHRRWTKILDRFRGLVIFHAQISSIVNEPARPGWRPR